MALPSDGVSASRTVAVVPAVPVGQVNVIGGDEAALRHFLARWLAPAFPADSASGMTVTIGAIPDDLPFRLPLPPDTSVVGALIGGPNLGTQILLETRQSAAQSSQFFQRIFEAQGFVQPLNPVRGSGFTSSDPAITLCRDEDNLALSIFALPHDELPADVRISIQSQDHSLCQQSKQDGSRAQGLLPTLSQPAGSSMSGGGDGDAYTMADLVSELSPAELSDHYAGQLAAAGWQQVEVGDDGPVAWSAWNLTDDDGNAWSGLLVIVSKPGSETGRLALLRVDRVK